MNNFIPQGDYCNASGGEFGECDAGGCLMCQWNSYNKKKTKAYWRKKIKNE